MKRFTYLAVILLAWGALTGCSEHQALQAPSSQEEAQQRFIIKGTTEQTAAVIAHSEGFRVLSKNHNLYEVSGLNYFQIKEIAPSIQATQNEYVEALYIKKQRNPYEALVSQFKSEAEEDRDEATGEEPVQGPANNIANVPPALQGCDLQAVAQPTPKLTVLNDVLQTSLTMNLGETVVFSDNGSLPVSEDDVEPLSFQWDVLAPAGSEIPQGLRTGTTLELTVDMVGMYQVIFVAKDSSNACAVIPARFLVTYDPDFEFPEDNEEMPQAKLDAFSHLTRVHAQQAWDKATGQGVTIAILDSGLHYNHRAIKFNLAVNENEKFGRSSADDDGNGFADDILGWDFVNNDNKPFDDEGHGSHVAGLAASHIHGLAKDAKIMPVKVMSASGGGDVATVIAGVYYAVDNGADVINASLGGFQAQVPLFLEALNHAQQQGVVFVSASGNSRLDLSLPGNEIYPGELEASNIINVAAVGVDANLASYSNFGKEEVDVAAPGGDQGEPLYSLATLNPRGFAFIGLGGTSMAAPVVAGVAALMIEANPNITPEEIRTIMMESGEVQEPLVNVVGSGRILSALTAVEKAAELPLAIANNQ